MTEENKSAFPFTAAANLDSRFTVMELFCGCIVRRPSVGNENYLLPCSTHGRERLDIKAMPDTKELAGRLSQAEGVLEILATDIESMTKASIQELAESVLSRIRAVRKDIP